MLRTTVGQEALVVDILARKVEREQLGVYSLAVVPTWKGYVLIEADNELTVRRAISNISQVKGKGIVGGEVKLDELTTVLEAKSLMKSFNEGDKVEIVSGAFKGERARVLRVNPTKEEVTVELLEAAVKIPLTLKAENIRVLKE
ncbi:MAG: transcription elongation factor Spt5 [Candidatus Diapherotrites archaeon]|uniref:Transcription elongation factor Spt5 n=1 Tax=Candidatus Iainarchaeum sp. TaxID=3101447 RepID=A0A8T4L1W5_9ARCH|nr:transcription elongation factor Spt5 [Candidatus Diapherotrites archaeon]